MLVAQFCSVYGQGAIAVGGVGVALAVWHSVNRPTAAEVLNALQSRDITDIEAWINVEPLLQQWKPSPHGLKIATNSLLTSSEGGIGASPARVAEVVAALNRTRDHSSLDPDTAKGVERWGPLVEMGRADLALPWIVAQGFYFDEVTTNWRNWVFRNAPLPADAQERMMHIRRLLTPPPPELLEAPLNGRKRRRWHRQATPLLTSPDEREAVVKRSNDPALFFTLGECRSWIAAPCADIADRLTTPALVDVAYALFSLGSLQPKQVGRVFEALQDRLDPASSKVSFLWNMAGRYLARSDNPKDLISFMCVCREFRDAGYPHLARRHARRYGEPRLRALVRPDKLRKAARTTPGTLNPEEWRQLGFQASAIEAWIPQAAQRGIKSTASLLSGFADSHEVALDTLDFGEMDRAKLGAAILKHQAMQGSKRLLVSSPDSAVEMALTRLDRRSAEALAAAVRYTTVNAALIKRHRHTLLALWHDHLEDGNYWGELCVCSEVFYRWLQPIPPEFAVQALSKSTLFGALNARFLVMATIRHACENEIDSHALGERLASFFRVLIEKNQQINGLLDDLREKVKLGPELNPADPEAFIKGLCTECDRADVQKFLRETAHPDSSLRRSPPSESE